MSDSDFTLLNLTHNQRLAYEVFKFCSPFASTGSFLISAYQFFTDQHQDHQDQLLETLDELADRVEATKEALLQKIEYTVLRDLTAQVNGIALGFSDYGATNSIGTLDNLLTQSALTRSAMEGYIDDASQPIEFRTTLAGLYTQFSASRIDILGAYKDRDGTNADALATRIADQKDKTEHYRPAFERFVRILNNSRFSAVYTQDINSMEPNTPIYVIGYDFEGGYKIVENLGNAIRRADYNRKRAIAEDKRDEQVAATYSEAWRPFEEYFAKLLTVT